MKEFEIIYQGVCLFCGNEAAEKFFSGSYETYLKCDCEGVKNYFKLSDALQAAKNLLNNY